MPKSKSPIEHVVVLMMENGSFDRMMGALAEVRPDMEGVDPHHPRSNRSVSGDEVSQSVTTSRNIDRDPKHYLPNGLAQYAEGANSGFVVDFERSHPSCTPEERREIMAYYPRGFLPALHMLAEQYVVCDHWFSSLLGPTWINRLFAHSGTSLGHVSEPGGLFTSKLHLYTERTLYDELTEAGAPWRIYYGDVPQSLVLVHQFEHLLNYRLFHHWRDDVAKGDLAGYTFIEPNYFGPHQNDQHPPHDVLRGDVLIADVYNALRANPALFERTLLIVLYDEHGGFYDHVAPPPTVAPDAHTQHYAFDRLGFRVPALLISPLLDPAIVKDVFDHTSLLKLASGLWDGVKPLGARAAQANDPLRAVKWRETPRRDLPEAPRAPDLQDARRMEVLEGFKASLFGMSRHFESQIKNAGLRGLLQARSHESLGDAWDQAKLATDRVAAFFEDGLAGGWVGKLGEGLRRAARRFGLG
jgi:phospholipase C